MALTALLLLRAIGSASADHALEHRVATAIATTWPHGVSDDLAHREVGPDGVPLLLAALADPDCERPDNVVAFLSVLAGDEAVDALLEVLDRPAVAAFSGSEDRARLLVPFALGRIAERGGDRALARLMDLSSLDRGRAGSSWDDDVLGMALGGLARVGEPAAVRRLEDWAQDERPSSHALRARAVSALTEGSNSEFARDAPSPVGDREQVQILDVEDRVHGKGLSWANHASLSNPMTTARLRLALRDVNLRAARADLAEDTACCVELQPLGLPGTFGTAGDGLDIVENASEAAAVLGEESAHVKVVRLIQFCGGSEAPNIGGCAIEGAPTMMVIRGPSPTIDGLLWMHEYGHNVGIADHDPRPGFIMGEITTQTNVALSPAHCDAFHHPVQSSGIIPDDLGPCTDVDGDGVHDLADNCPDTANPGQEDQEGDGLGDACDPCPGDSGPDADLDGICDDEDRCPLINDLFDTDTDGVPDCLDGCPLDTRKAEPLSCGCGELETDRDEDGVADCVDACPDEPGKTEPGTCGCDVADTDSDEDGTPDCVDACPDDPFKALQGDCGCGVADEDSDADGALDCLEECPDDPFKQEAGDCGCGQPDADSDGDGVLDCVDACPADPEKDEAGDCGCGHPDLDGDGDGVADCLDDCPLNPLEVVPGVCGCGLLERDNDNDGMPDCVVRLLGDVEPENGDGDVDLADWFAAREELLAGGVSPSAIGGAVDLHPLALEEDSGPPPLAWCPSGDGFFDAFDLAVLRSRAAGVAEFVCRMGRPLVPVMRRIPGDLEPPEGDGRLDVRDVVVALTLAVGIGTPTPEQLRRGDVAPTGLEDSWQVATGDGLLNVRDVIIMLQAAVGATELRWPQRELGFEVTSEEPASAVQLRISAWPTWATELMTVAPACSTDAHAGLDEAESLVAFTCAPDSPLTGSAELLRLRYRAIEAVSVDSLVLEAVALAGDLRPLDGGVAVTE